MMCKIKKCSLSKKAILGMIDPEVFSTNEKLASLIKLSQTQCMDAPSSGEPFELYSSGSAENGDCSDATIKLLAVTISCVMLMASDMDGISDNSLTWAERYLGCIKDEDGLHPPNIQGILNHISLLRSKRNSDSDLTMDQKLSISEMECQSDQILECSPCNVNPSFLYS